MANWDERAERWIRRQAERDEVFRPATEMMLDMANIKAGYRVLDVAAGAGGQTLLAAQRVGPNGHVLAIDTSSAMLTNATEAIRKAGFTNVETRVMDAENLDLDADSFDVIICRLGLMLFPDPLKALRGMSRVLMSGGMVAALVFSAVKKNPYEGIPSTVAHRRGRTMPPMFTLAETGVLEDTFRNGGFPRVSVHAVTTHRRF